MRTLGLSRDASPSLYTPFGLAYPRVYHNHMGPSGGLVTQLLVAWRAGDETAKDQLFALLYADLHQIAHEQRKKWRGSSTLNTTALIHELYVRLSRQGAVRAEDRGQLNRFVAKALRHILIDYAEKQGRQRRGGGWLKIPLDALPGEEEGALDMQLEESLMIDAALSKLETIDARLADVVELRFYGGLTYDEIAQSLGISKRTVTRDWAQAKLLLRRIMQDASRPSGQTD